MSHPRKADWTLHSLFKLGRVPNQPCGGETTYDFFKKTRSVSLPLIFIPITDGLGIIIMATYETFAAVYDAVMDDSLYDLWTDFSLRHLPKTKDKKKLLELACGTVYFPTITGRVQILSKIQRASKAKKNRKHSVLSLDTKKVFLFLTAFSSCSVDKLTKHEALSFLLNL